MPPALYVATAAELPQALHLLSDSDFIALDTEFMRESTYFPKLCLIQAATSQGCVLIDPLAVPDLGALWELLAQRERVKVLHAARQDLEVMGVADTRLGRTPPAPIFDTQIAAALLGHPSQVGYASLVTLLLQHTLAKEHTRADWTRRPLSAEQLDYAVDDVRYLVPLYHDLRAALVAADRLSWLYEETAEFEQERLYRVEPDAAWKRLKGLDRLHPHQRATAKLLAQWRESMAVTHDRPRGWILADDALREIAERLPTSEHALGELRTLPAGVLRKRGSEILALVEQAREKALDESNAFIPPRPEPEQLARVTKLMNFVRTQAQEQRIAPELLATRRDAEQLVFAGKAESLLKGWRRAVIGERLVELARS
jgi:ribonuclease D